MAKAGLAPDKKKPETAVGPSSWLTKPVCCCSRWFVGAGVPVAGRLFCRQTLSGQKCVNRGICSNCGVFSSCGLPQALSAKLALK